MIINNALIDDYFRIIMNWDDDAKKDMIKRISQSIKSENQKKYDFSSCFGAWEDNRSGEEIVNLIYKDRINKSDLEVL
jgi:hypothetical protein